MGISQIHLERHVPIRLWEVEKCSERDSTDRSRGVILGMELILKLWQFYPEIIYIYILEPSKNIHINLNSIVTDKHTHIGDMKK